MAGAYRAAGSVRCPASPCSATRCRAQFSPSGLVHVDGGVTRPVADLGALVGALEAGLDGRSVAHTELNAESSRSHLIVTLVLTSTNHRSGHETRGKLTLVDQHGAVGKASLTAEHDEAKDKVYGHLNEVLSQWC